MLRFPPSRKEEGVNAIKQGWATLLNRGPQLKAKAYFDAKSGLHIKSLLGVFSNKFLSKLLLRTLGKCTQATLMWFAGRMWPAGRTLPTNALKCSRRSFRIFVILFFLK